MERRTVTIPVEIRADEDRPQTLVGYAAVFNAEARIAGMFREVIAPGAFRSAVERDDVRGLFNHDPNYVLGRTAAGTLRLIEDERGLRYEIDVPDTQWARDLMVSVRRGDVSQSSFAFEVESDGDETWDYPKGEMPLRTIRAAKLYDVSPVTYPAYESTTVSARSRQAAARAAAPSIPLSLDRDRLAWAEASNR